MKYRSTYLENEPLKGLLDRCYFKTEKKTVIGINSNLLAKSLKFEVVNWKNTS